MYLHIHLQKRQIKCFNIFFLKIQGWDADRRKQDRGHNKYMLYFTSYHIDVFDSSNWGFVNN